MAQVPQLRVPEGGQAAAPVPFQNVEAPPLAFGANVVGQGLKQVAAADQSVSDTLAQHAEQFQAINNKVAADTASVGAISALDKMRLDYQNNNQGMAAVDNLPKFYSDVEQTRAKFGENLSPLALVEYNSASRRYVANVQSNATEFATGQRKKAAIDSSNAVIGTNQALAAAAGYGTPQFDEALGAIAHEVAFQSRPDQLGLTPEAAAFRLHSEVGAIFQSQIKQAIDGGNFEAAQSIFTDHKSDMTLPQIDAVAGALKVGATARVSQGFAQDIANGLAPQDERPSVAVGANAVYLAGVHGREGNGDNPRSTASGTGQFIEGTWLHTLKTDPQFAGDIQGKSDAQILALRNNASIADRAIVAYGAANAHILQQAGIAPTLANVGMAHGFGPQGAEALLRADPNAVVSSVLPADVLRANPSLANATVGQVVQGFQHRFGSGTLDMAQASTVKLPPPPRITPNEDPAQIQADYDTYITTSAHALYGDNPALEASSIQSARSRIAVNIQQVQANQTASYNRLFLAVEGGQSGSDPRPLDIPSLVKAYPGAANDLANLPPKSQSQIGEYLNRANSPTGNFVTPHMTAQAEELKGMSITHPDKFAHADLTQYDLSGSDRKSFVALQAKEQSKETKSIQLKTYLSNPIVSALIRTNFPVKAGDQEAEAKFNGFIGALQGQIDALQLKEGHAPTQAEVSSAAQNLITSTGGMFNKTKPLDIPRPVEAQITAQFQKAYGRPPHPDELNYAFQRGPSYYGR